MRTVAEKDPNRLYCKFCNFSTVKEYSKGGKFYGIDKAHSRVARHVIMAHYREWERIQNQLDEEESALPSLLPSQLSPPQ